MAALKAPNWNTICVCQPMVFSIRNIGFCPTSPFDDVTKHNCYETSFYTSGHGRIAIRTGSESEAPRDYKKHLFEAAQILMQQHPEYEDAVRHKWKLHAV